MWDRTGTMLRIVAKSPYLQFLITVKKMIIRRRRNRRASPGQVEDHASAWISRTTVGEIRCLGAEISPERQSSNRHTIDRKCENKFNPQTPRRELFRRIAWILCSRNE